MTWVETTCSYVTAWSYGRFESSDCSFRLLCVKCGLAKKLVMMKRLVLRGRLLPRFEGIEDRVGSCSERRCRVLGQLVFLSISRRSQRKKKNDERNRKFHRSPFIAKIFHVATSG